MRRLARIFGLCALVGAPAVLASPVEYRIDEPIYDLSPPDAYDFEVDLTCDGRPVRPSAPLAWRWEVVAGPGRIDPDSGHYSATVPVLRRTEVEIAAHLALAPGVSCRVRFQLEPRAESEGAAPAASYLFTSRNFSGAALGMATFLGVVFDAAPAASGSDISVEEPLTPDLNAGGGSGPDAGSGIDLDS
jgi:hypothetical protein